jgi:hypothetical protein
MNPATQKGRRHMIKSIVGVFVTLLIIGLASFSLHGCGDSSGSSSAATTVYDIEASINALKKDGKLSQMDVVLWNTVPQLPSDKKWKNVYGDKLQFEEIMKDLCARQLSQMSKPLRDQIVLLRSTYEKRGLE